MAQIKTEELRRLLEQDKLLIGTERTTLALKLGKLKRVLFASNTSEATRFDLNRLAEIASVPVVELSQNNQELGTVCRKKHAISVIGELA